MGGRVVGEQSITIGTGGTPYPTRSTPVPTVSHTLVTVQTTGTRRWVGLPSTSGPFTTESHRECFDREGSVSGQLEITKSHISQPTFTGRRRVSRRWDRSFDVEVPVAPLRSTGVTQSRRLDRAVRDTGKVTWCSRDVSVPEVLVSLSR